MAIFYITGIKHSGKSRLSACCAEMLAPTRSIERFDLDELILSETAGQFASIRQLYRDLGKHCFMELERDALVRLLQSVEAREHTTTLVATGGGICDNEAAVALMHASGTIIYLHVAQEALYQRIAAAGIPPFLEGSNPREAFDKLYAERDGRYGKIADLVLKLAEWESVEHNATLLCNSIVALLEGQR